MYRQVAVAYRQVAAPLPSTVVARQPPGQTTVKASFARAEWLVSVNRLVIAAYASALDTTPGQVAVIH